MPMFIAEASNQRKSSPTRGGATWTRGSRGSCVHDSKALMCATFFSLDSGDSRSEESICEQHEEVFSEVKQQRLYKYYTDRKWAAAGYVQALTASNLTK